MLAELAAFNAAYATIRTAISHGRELSSCVKQIGQMVDAKQELTEKANRRKNGFMAKLKGQTADDLEEFMALEKMREADEQLRQIMIYAGRPGLWGDWQRFQAQARKDRIRAREEAEKAREKLFEMIAWIAFGLAMIGLVVGFFFYIWWLKGA